MRCIANIYNISRILFFDSLESFAYFFHYLSTILNNCESILYIYFFTLNSHYFINILFYIYINIQII